MPFEARPKTAGFDNKIKKTCSPWFCLSGSFHCDPIHQKSFLQVRPIRITNPKLRGQANLLFFFFSFLFSEAPCQTQLPLLTLIVILFLYYPISSSFTVNFLTFVLIQITEVIYMLTALSCFSSSLTSPPYFLPFLSPIDKGLTSP